MSLVRSALFSLASLALTACAVPNFPVADDVPPQGDPDTALPPVEGFTCEDPNQVVCAPGACPSLCHMAEGPRQATFTHCKKSATADGVLCDNCEGRNVCLEPAPNTSQGSFCFALCRSDADCPGGVSCGERPLSDGSSVRVCDPAYQNCGESCCNPTILAGKACDLDRPCYLVLAPSLSREASWTVCEYSSGGARKGEPCTLSRDCIEGLTCVGADSEARGSGTCLVACDPGNPGACGANGQCQPFPKHWGYCL